MLVVDVIGSKQMCSLGQAAWRIVASDIVVAKMPIIR